MIKNRFVKIVYLFIIILISFTLISCNATSIVVKSTSVTTTAVTTNIPVTTSINQLTTETTKVSSTISFSSDVSTNMPTTTTNNIVQTTQSIAATTINAKKTTTTIPTEVMLINIDNYVGKNINSISINNINIIIVEKISKKVDNGIIIAQNIKAGSQLEKGQTIIFEVSIGENNLVNGYNLTTNNIPKAYSKGIYSFSINRYDNNVFLRTIEGIVVKNQLIFSDCHSMFFDNNDTIYFKKISNGYIYSYSLSKRKETLLINENCNYYRFFDNTIFYSTNTKVIEYNISSKSKTTLVNTKATHFQIYNNSVFTLETIDGKNKVKEISIDNSTIKDISTIYVNAFIINDFKVYYYKSGILVYIDLYDYEEYTATNEQKSILNF